MWLVSGDAIHSHQHKSGVLNTAASADGGGGGGGGRHKCGSVCVWLGGGGGRLQVLRYKK